LLDYKSNLTIIFFIVLFLFIIVIDKENELISNDHLLIKSVFAIPPEQDLIVLYSWKINTTNIKDIALDFTGSIYFTEYASNKIARFTPSTNTITEWNIPTKNSGPTDLVIFGTSVYFLENKTDKIGRYNYIQNVFTEWDISKSPYLVAADSVGNIFFVDKEKIARIS
jgi:hypothetical protein